MRLKELLHFKARLLRTLRQLDGPDAEEMRAPVRRVIRERLV